jgi:hypothetical protein
MPTLVSGAMKPGKQIRIYLNGSYILVADVEWLAGTGHDDEMLCDEVWKVTFY